MHDFKYILSLNESDFTSRMAEIDSSELINYLKNCNDLDVKEKYHKRIENILGIGYLKLLKMAVDGEDNFTGTIV